MYEAWFDKLAGVKQVMPTQWRALCPAHEDHTPSMYLEIGGDGKLIFGCRAGCKREAILAALKFEWQDAFPPKEQAMAGKIVATFEYRDEQGNVLFVVDRVEPGREGRKKDFPCKRMVAGKWEYKLGDVRRVVYRLPELLGSGNRMVLIVEGERKADLLASWGFIATCSPGGAGKWRKEYGEWFRGRTVLVLPDNDEAGRNHAAQVLEALKDVAKKVTTLELPGLGEKGDVIDWAGGKDRREEFKELVKPSKKPETPEPPPQTNGHSKSSRSARLLKLLSDHLESCPAFADEFERALSE